MFKKIFYGWWIVLACFVIGFYVGGIIYFGFTAFFEPLRKEFGWSYTQISFAASLRGLEMGFLAPVIGFLLNRFGSRALIFSGTFAVGLGLILLCYTQSLAMFYGAFLLLAFGAGGCITVVPTTTVAHWFRKKVSIALGVTASGVGAGGLMVPVIVYFIDTFNWRNTFLFLGLGMWFIGIPLSFVIRSRPELYGLFPDGKESTGKSLKEETPVAQNEGDFNESLKSKAFLFLTGADTLRMMSVTAVVTHMMPYLNSVGISRTTAGLVAAALPIISIIGRFGFGWLGDVFQKRHMMIWSLFLMATGILAWSYAEVWWLIILFLVFFPLGQGGSIVLKSVILREHFRREFFGKLLGIELGVTALGGMIGPVLAGWVFDYTGSYHLIWMAFCAANIIAMGLILRMR